MRTGECQQTLTEERESTMKTEPEPFAVDLSNDGIFLWHRKPAQKWEFLGSVPLNSGNLRQQLEVLKTTALGIEAPSMNAVVRIPTAEVQTLTVAHDPQAGTSWEIRIISALEAVAGAPIKSLVFDIDRGDGTSDISVAWTPISVIKQAEIFVHLIGFIPTRYTTDVDASAFPRNPNFHLIEIQETTAQPPLAAAAFQAIPAPVAAASEPEPIEPYIKPKKNDFGFVWFVILFAIIAVLIAGIFYWPHLKQLSVTQIYSISDQPFIATVTIMPQFTLKKVKQSYS